jgi:cytochrome b561
VKGLVLVALLVTAITGVGWLAVQGTAAAFEWRTWHLYAARTFAGLLVAHVVAVALHVVAIARG